MFTCRRCDSLGPLGPPQEVVGGWKPPKTKQQRGKLCLGLPQLPNPPGTPLLGTRHHPHPPAAVPGGLPPMAAGTSPLPLEDLRPGAADLFSRTWGELRGSAPRAVRGEAGRFCAGGAEPARLLLLSAPFQPFSSTSWQPGAR